MRTAEVSDVWRNLFRRPYEVSYERLSFRHVKRIGTGSASFKPGITAVVGGNGVGKSTLMATIIRSLGPAANNHSAALFDADGVEVSGTLRKRAEGELVTTSMEGNDVRVTPAEAEIPKYEWIDPSTYATKAQGLIIADGAFEENLEGIDPEQYSETECDVMSYIVGKQYDRIEVYEIDYATGLMPYFVVQDGGVRYDSAEMGLGELSLFLIYWRMRNIEPNTIVLVEEPETHVSPRSQEALVNVCADICVRKSLHLIVTTHSPFVICQLPTDHICLLARNGPDILAVTSPTHVQIANILGDRVNYHGVILVEDDMAKAVTIGLLRVLAPELLKYYEIVAIQSSDDLAQCLTRVPELKNWFSMVGIFDGDQRERIGNRKFRWPHAFLPGDATPEALLRLTIERQPDHIAATVNRPIAQLAIALESARGMENHEWLHRTKDGLTLDLGSFVDGVIRVWLESDENRRACDSLLDVLERSAFLTKRP